MLRAYVNGTILAEESAGSPPLLVALHGWGRSRSDLLPLVQGRYSVAVDLPGFGSSPPPPAAWGSAEYASVVGATIEEIAPDCGVIVVGHSFGGRVAVRLAATRPDLVNGLVLSGVPLLRTSSGARAPIGYRVIRRARRWRLVSQSRLDQARNRFGSTDYKAAQGVMRDVLVRVVNESYDSDLRKIECPVGFCWGALDTAAPLSIAGDASKLVRRVEVFNVSERSGHDVHRQDPDLFCGTIEAIVRAIA